ncbi:glycoside hydrolase family 43 protein [Sporormia fimetaria CBS 119925]|uniref:Glycoside hydrolase family 43 protein n=1 Tax=Sporormia fimetaria CBS 119925 TaxID=1340428 RepID=A0A6A6UZ28_9PLEO|nr:glycoside hydrolase family 43 protein [Sporormia fimetaria CBS 119925]
MRLLNLLHLLPAAALQVAPVTCQNNSSTYTNPILDTVGADPWVIRHGDYYYMTYTTNSDITLLRSRILTNWNNADRKTLFLPPPGQNYSTDIWAPELHFLSGAWHIIFTADPNHDSPPPDVDMYCTYSCPAIYHRMFVLSSSSSSSNSTPDPWTATFPNPPVQLNTFDQFAIDGTYFTHASNLYHIYSCWDNATSAWPANLCITHMSSPTTISSSLSQRVTISRPTNPWEKTPYGRTINDRLSSNEAPQQLINPHTNQTFLIYSAARSDNANYCLGQLELVGNDPMSPDSWTKHDAGCVFYQDPENQAYGVGHASFVKSPDGKEDWIVYHGMRDPRNGWAARTIRTQRFTWNEDGTPNFPRPGYRPYQVPSGQDTGCGS